MKLEIKGCASTSLHTGAHRKEQGWWRHAWRVGVASGNGSSWGILVTGEATLVALDAEGRRGEGIFLSCSPLSIAAAAASSSMTTEQHFPFCKVWLHGAGQQALRGSVGCSQLGSKTTEQKLGSAGRASAQDFWCLKIPAALSLLLLFSGSHYCFECGSKW